MSVTLPYLASPGSIKNVLEKIKMAAIPPYLKKIGFVASDGTPTEIYKRLRNHVTSGAAVAEAIKIGYKELEIANEYFYELNEKDLLALIVQVTGVEAENNVAKLTLSTLDSVVIR